MRTRMIAAGLGLLLSATASAETLKGGYPACMSEDLLDQLVQASVRKDERGFEYLMKNGCVMAKPGLQVSVLDTTLGGKAKVRAYAGNNAMVLWTVREAINR